MIKQLCKLPPSYHKVRCSSVLLADEVKIVSNQKQVTNIYVDAFGAIRLIFFPSIILFALRGKSLWKALFINNYKACFMFSD